MNVAADLLSCALWLGSGALACGLFLALGLPEAKMNVILGTALPSGAIAGGAAFAYLRHGFIRWVSSEPSGVDVYRYSLTRPRGYFLSISFGILLASALAACFRSGLRGEGAGWPGLVALGLLVAWFVGYPFYVGYTVRCLSLRVDAEAAELRSRRKSVIRIRWDGLESVILEGRRVLLLVAKGGKRLVLNRPDGRFAWHIEGFDALLERILAEAGTKVTNVPDLVKAAAGRRGR